MVFNKVLSRGFFDDDFCVAFKTHTGKELLISEIKTHDDVGLSFTCEGKTVNILCLGFYEHNIGLISIGRAKASDFDWKSIWFEKVIKAFEG